MIEITQAMKDIRKENIASLEAQVDMRIKGAVERGETECYFPISKSNQYYSEIVDMYQRAGYYIRPTGYSGGVWQLTERICW